ncbi:methyltransferase domain-containing protein [Alkalihalobacterium alkalinitrilicum]|uniref:methyltransferase domain-containing protein n=1 Tax=Alkalihalobacterium alkalinitrilicum TaxID=427920 RepID=UPI000994CD09|nr:methyltransferase domain-containing protein [Alkalihalobacterium alkalinitrilicum]
MNSREKWNQKYEDRLKFHELPAPNSRLQKLIPYLNGGTALDLACGLGANSIFLAKQKYKVESFDISEIAIQHLKEQVEKNKLTINPTSCDLTNMSFLNGKTNLFDLVVITYYLDRSLFPLIPSLIKDDGYFFMETFYLTANSQHKVSNQYKLQSGELLSIFSDWHVLFYEENEYEGRQTIFVRKKSLTN